MQPSGGSLDQHSWNLGFSLWYQKEGGGREEKYICLTTRCNCPQQATNKPDQTAHQRDVRHDRALFSSERPLSKCTFHGKTFSVHHVQIKCTPPQKDHVCATLMERRQTESPPELRNGTKAPTLTTSVQRRRPGQKQLNKKKNKQKTSRSERETLNLVFLHTT